MTTKEQNEINQNIGRFERIKHKMANPRELDTHVRRDREWLVSEVDRLRAEIVAMLSTGLLLNARWVHGWCLVHPGSNFDTQCKRLVELGAWRHRSVPDDVESQFDEQNASYQPIEPQEQAESEVSDG